MLSVVKKTVALAETLN